MIDYIQKYKLDDKVAFVMGGAGLIGSEISKAFASIGAKTIILDLDKLNGEKLKNDLLHDGYSAEFRKFDCEDMENLEKNFLRLLDELGPIDIFINCSYPRTKAWSKSSFDEVTFSSFRKNVDVHMNSYAWFARLAAENMKKNNIEGSIIQTGSIYGILGQDKNIYENTEMKENMIYSAIKGGIVNLTRQMASYYGEFNIRINTLIPGGLEGHVAGKEGKQNPTFIKNYSKKTPLNRLGRADEVASAAIFLGSSASSYLTGTMIIVDGGISII